MKIILKTLNKLMVTKSPSFAIILCLWYATNQTSEILFHIGLPIFVGESLTDLEWSVQCSECLKHLCRACFTYTV